MLGSLLFGFHAMRWALANFGSVETWHMLVAVMVPNAGRIFYEELIFSSPFIYTVSFH